MSQIGDIFRLCQGVSLLKLNHQQSIPAFSMNRHADPKVVMWATRTCIRWGMQLFRHHQKWWTALSFQCLAVSSYLHHVAVCNTRKGWGTGLGCIFWEQICKSLTSVFCAYADRTQSLKKKRKKKEFFFCKVTSGWLFCYYEGLHCEKKEEVGVSSAGPWHKSVKSACCCCLWWQLVPFRNGPGEKRKLYCTWHCDHQSCWTLTIWEWLQFTHEHWWAFIQDANLHALQLTLAILFHLTSS